MDDVTLDLVQSKLDLLQKLNTENIFDLAPGAKIIALSIHYSWMVKI